MIAVGTLYLQRPNRISLQMSESPAAWMRGVSNGKELFLEDTGEKLYRQLPAPDLRNGDTEPFLWGGLLVDQFLDPKGLPGQTTYAGVRRLGKKRYQVVRIAAPSGRGTTDL